MEERQQYPEVNNLNLDNELFNISNIQIKCLGQNQIFYLCTNSQCISQPQHKFLCYLPKCKCKQKHKFCLKGDIETILEAIKSKTLQISEIKICIQSYFDKLIDQLSDCRDKLIQKISKNDMKYSSLHYLQNFFLKAIGLQSQIMDQHSDVSFLEFKERSIGLKSKQASQLWNVTIQKNENQNFVFQSIRKQLNKYQQSQTQTLQNLSHSIQNINGSDKINTTIKEWEVWKVEF